MEAFDHFPSSGCHLDPIVIQTSDRLQRTEATVATTQESCFMILSSHETREESITVMEQKPVLEERNYLNEAVALAKMVFHLEKYGMVENTMIPDNISLKALDNNPFRTRKRDEVPLDQTDSNTEQVSEVTEVEKSDIFCATLESQETVDSKPKNIIDRKQRSINVKKLKKSNSKSSKSSILNFFSRV